MRSLAHLLRQHRSLLNDDARLSAYAEAIARTVRPDDVVLDLGSGTGILAMLAARAGARRVFAIESEHVVDAAAMLARQNGLAVEWFHALSSQVELPEPATLLITETLGNLGFDEGILGSVIDARQRLLARDARIVPESVSLIAAPVEAAELFEKRVGFWDTPRQGMDLTLLQTFASNQIWNADLSPSALLAAATPLFRASLTSVTSSNLRGGTSFVTTRSAALHGFGLWFSASLVDGLVLSNEPPLRTSNWRQAFLPLERPVSVREGAGIHFQVESDDGAEWRWHGTIESHSIVAFDQTTRFGFAPCTIPSAR